MYKKYYTIKEVAEILSVADYKLRYLEKISPDLAIQKIRGRRYYQISDIEKLKIVLKSENGQTIIEQIDQLIKKFKNLINNDLAIK